MMATRPFSYRAHIRRSLIEHAMSAAFFSITAAITGIMTAEARCRAPMITGRDSRYFIAAQA